MRVTGTGSAMMTGAGVLIGESFGAVVTGWTAPAGGGAVPIAAILSVSDENAVESADSLACVTAAWPASSAAREASLPREAAAWPASWSASAASLVWAAARFAVTWSPSCEVV